MTDFPGEKIVVIDSSDEFFAVATSKSIRTFTRQNIQVLSFEVAADLQPIADLRIDESFKFFGVVGGKSARIFDAKNAESSFDLKMDGEEPVGIRFDYVRKAIVVATVSGLIFTFTEPDSVSE